MPRLYCKLKAFTAAINCISRELYCFHTIDLPPIRGQRLYLVVTCSVSVDRNDLVSVFPNIDSQLRPHHHFRRRAGSAVVLDPLKGSFSLLPCYLNI